MNRTLKKLLLVAGSTIPALAMFAGTASADVSANNKLKNGDFAAGTAHWAPSALPKLTTMPGWGALFASNNNNAAYATLGTATQCVPVTSNFTYELSGKMFVPAGQDRTGHVGLEVQYFAAPGCSGYLKQYVTAPMSATGSWKFQKMTAKAPKGAESALVRIRVHKNAANWLQDPKDPFYAFFDDVQLLSKTIIYPGPLLPDFPLDNGNPGNDPDPTPTPDDDEEDPAPDPQDEPDPTPAPEDEPAEPEDNGETVEEDVPAQPAPEVPDVPADDEPTDAPANNQDNNDGDNDAPAANSDSNSQGSDAPAQDNNDDEGAEDGNNEPLTGSDDEPKGSGNGAVPTPAAPEAGNAATEDNGLLGPTELGIAAAAGLVLVGLAFVAGSRRGGRREERELPFE